MPRRKAVAEKKQGQQSKTATKPIVALSSSVSPSTSTFHVLEAVLEPNGKIKGDEAASEYDSVSNNGSCSGESEDQAAVSGKEKPTIIPGLEAPLDKQEKIRLRNEKKHQRQKERKAKELRERCDSCLMSNKLERLAQQLVVMGFPQDRATMALILNDGHIEQSITYLLDDGGREVKKVEDCNLKIDISQELRKIADIEVKYKFPRPDIEKAIIACEGDIDSACAWLQQHHPAPEPKEHIPPQLANLHLRTEQQRQALWMQQVHHQQQQQQQQQTSGLHPKLVPAGGASALVATSPWQRGPSSPGVMKPVSGIMLPTMAAAAAAAAAAAGGHPQRSFREQLPVDMRAFPLHQVHVAGSTNHDKRLEDLLLFPEMQRHQHQQQQQQQQLQGYHIQQAAALNGIWSSSSNDRVNSSVPSNKSSADDWNAKAFTSIDYQSIDWSVGLSSLSSSLPVRDSNFVNQHHQHRLRQQQQQQQVLEWEHQEHLRIQEQQQKLKLHHHHHQQLQQLQQQQQQQQLQQLQQLQQRQQQQEHQMELPELPDLLSPEWTTPFAGKDLFQHQPVPLL